jgi:hypothetical protein
MSLHPLAPLLAAAIAGSCGGSGAPSPVEPGGGGGQPPAGALFGDASATLPGPSRTGQSMEARAADFDRDGVRALLRGER